MHVGSHTLSLFFLIGNLAYMDMHSMAHKPHTLMSAPMCFPDGDKCSFIHFVYHSCFSHECLALFRYGLVLLASLVHACVW